MYIIISFVCNGRLVIDGWAVHDMYMYCALFLFSLFVLSYLYTIHAAVIYIMLDYKKSITGQ